MPINPGTYVEGFEVVSRISGGGMGEIWLARDLMLGRSVALKVLRSDLTHDAERVTRFLREARAASALNHPNVCTIHAVGETSDGEHFIAMEHVDGPTLRERMASAITIPESIDIAVQIASALAATHEAGIVHRDLKPENVLIRPDGLVKIVDFGIATLAPRGATSDVTVTGLNSVFGSVFGTIPYMSPEQARGLQVDARTDIWSLGVVLYEMTAGRHPFAGLSGTDTLAEILHRDPPALRQLEPTADVELERIIGKALHKDRVQRYQSAKDLLLDLRALHARLTRAGTGESSEAGRTHLFTGRDRAKSAVTTESLRRLTNHPLRVAAVAVLLAAAVAGYRASWRQPSRPVADPPRMVVLPFDTIGSGDGYLADGITEAVTTELGRVGGLQVIASNTAFGYRKAANREVARTLDVQLVVRGSVQQAGDKIRIDVSLIDASQDTALWSERYHEAGTDLLAIQDEISRMIAATLADKFGTDRSAKSRVVGTRNAEAYNAFLRGLWHLKGGSADYPSVPLRVSERRLAVQELEKAVEEDPGFALAHAALASAYTQRFFYDVNDGNFEKSASRQIEQALAIDPNLGEAYLARAQLVWNAPHDFPHEAAVADLRRAVSINPNLAQAYVELEKVFYHVGLTQRAIDMHQLAALLDPAQATFTNRAFSARVDAGQVEEVRAELARQLPLGPFRHGEALVMLGELDQALELLSTSSAVVRGDPDYDPAALALLGAIYARQNRRQDAERVVMAVLAEAENRSALSHIHHAQFQLGAALAWLDRHDEAIRWLEKAAQQGYPSYTKFSSDPSLEPLRDHPRFIALLARLREDHERWAKSW